MKTSDQMTRTNSLESLQGSPVHNSQGQLSDSWQRGHRSSGVVRLGEYDNNHVYFAVRHTYKKCASCNRKTCFYFWIRIEPKGKFGWRRCFSCLSEVELKRLRELYPLVRKMGVRP